MALPAAKALPAGVEIKQFGDAEIMGEVFESFAKAMGAGIMMVYAVLVLLFGSFLQPVTILFSLPLSIGGAIVDAGRKRARPIIMTTIAMIGGMLPSAYGVGSGGEFRSPMAIAVIGGLMSSTLLSLVFVPAVFAVMDDVAKLGWRLFARFIGPGEEEVAPPRPGPVPAE